MRILLLLACLSLAACAQSPGAIQPAYVSSIPYESWTCRQLGDEQHHVAAALAQASTQQEQARTNDVVGVLLIGLPVSSISGENIAPQIAHLKGAQEAVRLAMTHNACSQARGWRVTDGQAVSDPSMVGKLATIELPRATQPASATTTEQPPIILAGASVPEVRNPLLIRAATVTPPMASAVHLNPPRGIMILSVGVGGAAMAAGLLERDVILDFDGSPVNDQSDMQTALAAILPASTVTATVWRDGTEKSVRVHF
jgi:PDZ domain